MKRKRKVQKMSSHLEKEILEASLPKHPADSAEKPCGSHMAYQFMRT
jgi:hypothetical protein